MNNKDIVIEEYKKLKRMKNFNITKLFCLDSVEHSLKWLNKKCSMDKKMEMAEIVHDYYLDTQIQISQISDIICEHWNDYLKNDNFNIYDYTEVF